MTTSNEQCDDEIICDCTGTSYKKILQLIKDGKASLEQISCATGASTGCGSCDILIMELIENSKQ